MKKLINLFFYFTKLFIIIWERFGLNKPAYNKKTESPVDGFLIAARTDL